MKMSKADGLLDRLHAIRREALDTLLELNTVEFGASDENDFYVDYANGDTPQRVQVLGFRKGICYGEDEYGSDFNDISLSELETGDLVDLLQYAEEAMSTQAMKR